jgi:large subunit ribosomal protein L25
MEQITLQAAARTVSTRGALNSIRKEGNVPGVLYNQHGKSQAVQVGHREFSKVAKQISESSIISLIIDGKEHACFVKDRQVDILTGQLLHIDFFEVEKNAVVHVKVPLHFSGTAAGVRAGGIFESPVHEIEVSAIPAHIPQHIEIDVSNLNANETIHVRDIKVSEHVKVLSSPDLVVALVKYAKAEEVAAPAAAEAAAPAAATAEAAPAKEAAK